MPDDRSELERIIEAARKSVRRWETLSKSEKAEQRVDCWEAIASELNELYIKQRAGRCNHRLTPDDVSYARRMAAWSRFCLELDAWEDDAENAAAQSIANRGGFVSDQGKMRLASKPKAPDTRNPPLRQPLPADEPRDWPPMTWIWSAWVDELLRVRRANAVVRVLKVGKDEEAAE